MIPHCGLESSPKSSDASKAAITATSSLLPPHYPDRARLRNSNHLRPKIAAVEMQLALSLIRLLHSDSINMCLVMFNADGLGLLVLKNNKKIKAKSLIMAHVNGCVQGGEKMWFCL